MVIILNIVDKIPLDKNIKLYRLIQNLLCPNIIKGPKYSDIKLNDITLRIFDPNNKSKILIYIHGGGWVSGNLDTHCNICYKLAEKLNRKVISIGYRLAPEYPFPAGLNDCYIVTKNIMENIEKLNIKSKDVIIMGDSAGANLAMSVSLMGLHNKTFRVGKIIMIYPTTQTDYSKKSIYKSLFYNDNKGFLTRKYMENWTNMYLPDEESKDNQYHKDKRLYNRILYLIDGITDKYRIVKSNTRFYVFRQILLQILHHLICLIDNINVISPRLGYDHTSNHRHTIPFHNRAGIFRIHLCHTDILKTHQLIAFLLNDQIIKIIYCHQPPQSTDGQFCVVPLYAS